jgi:hypothetical protein
VYVSLGLKKLGDFIVSEGHGYPLVTYNEMLCWFEVERFFLHGVMTLLECFAWALLVVMPEQYVHRATPSPFSQKKVLHQVSCGDEGELGFLDTYISAGQFSSHHLVLDIVPCENWIENRSLVRT